LRGQVIQGLISEHENFKINMKTNSLMFLKEKKCENVKNVFIKI